MKRLFSLATLLLLPLLASAGVRLPSLIGDHMVIQRDQPVHVWGWAEAGEKVDVSFRGKSGSDTADHDGRWSVYLAPEPAGGPYEMIVAGKNKITVSDILVGDVWVGSGQSNMQFTVARGDDAEKEIKTADFPKIRLFMVPLVSKPTPQEDVEGEWMLCSPETVSEFSAVLYFFGRHLHQKTGVPFGLIRSAWGGTPAESWTTLETLQSDASLAWVRNEWRDVVDAYPRAKAHYERELAEWEKDKKGRRPAEPRGPGHQHEPAGLYNAMIAPLTPFPIKGATWYQGENNANRRHGYSYRHLFTEMIRDWRRAWGVGDFPFLFVQLANYARPDEDMHWPELREAQLETLELVNTGMAVTIDIGESQDIHPTNKQDVGKRLALAARALAYGERDLVYSGPIYRQMSVEGSKARLWFDHVGGGLTARGDGLMGFEVAGADGQFRPAQAAIEGDTIVAWSPAVAKPVAVRYAWERDPAVSLFNKEGLPASPFRTDRWRR